jgi:hypothetical protein
MSKTQPASYDVRWRINGSNTAWSEPQRFKAGAEIVLNGLTPAKTYAVQARAIGPRGSMSAWASQGTYTVPTINQRLTQGNLNMLRVGGVGSAWTGFSISYTATSTSATISCTAGTLQDGDNNPSYTASSIAVSGTAGSAVTYYLYYDDFAGAGGTLPLGATTRYSDLSANQGRVFVGQVDVTYPTSGSGSGGGSPGGGGGVGCVTIDTPLFVRRNGIARWMPAGRVEIGDELHLDDGTWGRVSYSVAKLQPCVCITTGRGIELECSTSAPIGTCRGDVLAPDLLGLLLPAHDFGEDVTDQVTRVKPIGLRWVQHITCENRRFRAGKIAGRALDHHNLKPSEGPI